MTHLIFGGFSIILLITLAMILIPIFRTREITQKQRYEIAGTVFIFFFAAAFAVYYYAGAPEVASLDTDRELQMAQVQRTISTQKTLLKNEPENPQAWMKLGGAYMMTGQYNGAINAYKKAVKITDGHPQAILGYASAMVAEAGGEVTPEAKESIDMVLVQEPQNPDAQYMRALHKMQTGNSTEAMKEMKDLYYTLPPGSPLKAHIDLQINQQPLPEE